MKSGPFRVVVYLLAVLIFTLATSNQLGAQQQSNNNLQGNPLVRVLHAKGILTDEDMAQISQASNVADADRRLARLLLSKGVISQADYDQTVAATNVAASSAAPSTVNASSTDTSGVHTMSAIYRVPVNAAAATPSATPDPATSAVAANAAFPQNASVSPTTIPSTNPIRALPVGGIKKGELTPAIKLAGIGITPYGFLKATFVHDTSSPGGDDFPLPGFLGDTGPNPAPEFHIKARSSRFGTNFEWLDGSPNLTVTGKFEFDFEGNFNRSDNRNLSSIRSYNPSIRLAYGRLDYKLGKHDTISGVIGQDWTPFASSTLPNMLETTGLGIAFGDLYERAPQVRAGYTHDFGKFQLMPEIAIVVPAVGNVPSAANLGQQLGFGERQGPDSATPQVEGRLVAQWQLDHAPGVSPAQIIFSFQEGNRSAIVLKADVPTAFKSAFPTGARVGSPTNGWDGEWQLPTRWFSLIGKYYSGSDLRYYFAGQLFSNYNDVLGMTGVVGAPSIDGSATVDFGLVNGIPTVAPQRPVRTAGGFAQLGIPISRLLGRDPDGRNAGWSVYMMYGTDQVKTRDLLRVAPGGSRSRSDMTVGTLNYKLNKWVSFSFEESLYRTRANTEAPFPLFEGIPQHEWRDLRSEGGAIFSF